jgi:hypothetical protein
VRERFARRRRLIRGTSDWKELQSFARAKFPASVPDDPPAAVFVLAKEQSFPAAASLDTFPLQPSGDNPGVVDDQQIPRVEQFGQL